MKSQRSTTCIRSEPIALVLGGVMPEVRIVEKRKALEICRGAPIIECCL